MARVEHRTALALIMSAVLVGGCAMSFSDGVALSRKGLRVVAIEGETKAADWAKRVDARVEYCKQQHLETLPEREECMGVYGDGEGWEDDFDALRLAYDLAADALEQLESAAKRIEARASGQKVDAR